MFRRLFWLLVGAGFGFGVSFWIMRTVKRTIERYSPDRVSGDLTTAARSFGEGLRAAAAEGRTAMREREEELRAAVENKSRPPA